jgi:arsenate reductase
VTVGRTISDTLTGIAPSDVPAFVLAQLVGAAVGVAIVAVLHPHPARGAVDRGPVAIEV